MTILVGITGGMGCGKSFCTRVIRTLGYPVYDVDAAAFRLQQRRDVALEIIQYFPDVVALGTIATISRNKLRDAVIGNHDALDTLTRIMDRYLLDDFMRWSHHQVRHKNHILFVDAPLLFEQGWNRYCTKVITVDAPEFIQHQRIMKRKGMTNEIRTFLTSRQCSRWYKRTHSDYIIPSGVHKGITVRKLKSALNQIRRM